MQLESQPYRRRIQQKQLNDSTINSRMPASFEFPHIRPLRDLCFIVGREIPSVSIRIAFSEMRRLVIIRGVVAVVQFESGKAASCVQSEHLSA